MKSQRGFDEFALILIAAVIFIGILAIYFASPSETAPTIYPKEISVYLLPNESSTITLKIVGNNSNIALSANDSISDFVKFTENNFPLFGEKEVKVLVNAPSSYGIYEGYIIAKSPGGEDSAKVRIVVSPSYVLKSRTLSLPDFNISFYGNEKVYDSKENDYVESSLFKNKKMRLVFQPGEELIEEAYLDIIISDVKGGELVVKQDDNVIFEGKASVGELKIPLNLTNLKSINFVTIEAKNPFWNLIGTKYEIYSAKIIAKLKGISKDFDLSLSKDEIDKFYGIEFSSILETSYPSPTLEIKVNNQIGFRDKVPITALRVNITKDLLGEKFVLSENNKISFSLISTGYINFRNVILKIYSRE